MKREVETVGRFEAHKTPTGDVVYFDPGPHAYFAAIKPNAKSEGGYSYVGDSRMLGVSTVSKRLDTNVDPLLHWAAGLDQEGIAELYRGGGDLDWLASKQSIAASLRDAELTWRHVRDKAADRGTSVHEDIFLALATSKRPPSLSSLSDTDRGYGQAAIKWWMDNQPEPLEAEQVTCDLGERVAGRFDLRCRINSEIVLIDAKTREKGAVRRSDHVQLAGYERCNDKCGIGRSDRQVALILTPWGEYREFPSLATEGDFLTALDAHRRGNDLEKRIKAAEKEAVAA